MHRLGAPRPFARDTHGSAYLLRRQQADTHTSSPLLSMVYDTLVVHIRGDMFPAECHVSADFSNPREVFVGSYNE